jgi:hypothetical protein
MAGGGSKPGERRGGRQQGSRNKRTQETLALIGDGESPCAFALAIMHDDTKKIELRMEAARIAAPYIHPRPQPEGRIVAFDLPEEIATPAALAQIHANILRAVADSQLSVDEAKDISVMLETHRRTIETVELEERLTKLEKTLGAQGK